MLKSLIVKNFAIIEDIHIDFKEGMTVLTGETGAGKSLIIDTISLLLGQRADTDMIRYGESKASITGVFSVVNPELKKLLERFGISNLDDLTIQREIYDTSKSTIKVNHTSVTLIMLKQIATLLADMHIQNDTFKLFNPETYLTMISPKNDSTYDTLLSEYVISYTKYMDAYKKYEHVLNGQKESLTQLEYLQYEKEELTNLNLEENLDVALTSEIAKLENHDKIFSSLTGAYACLEDQSSTLDQIYEASTYLKKIIDLDTIYQEYYEKVLDSFYILDEIKSNVRKLIDELDFNQDELNQKIERLNAIEKAKTKYKMSLHDLIQYLEDITLKIDMVQNYDELLAQSKKTLEENYQMISKTAKKLQNYRKKLAEQIEAGIMKECRDLDLEETNFKIQFKEIAFINPFHKDVFKENGVDEIEFMISFNKGEPLKPLHKVASGGEMSRIMLAFKSYFSAISNLSFMVFDEIDTGVSGATAKKIALKMKAISKYNQILCITHLPQVASIGDYHIHIFKELKNDRTTTHYRYLDLEDRTKEIAMMLSGDKMSLYALEHAKALLETK